MGSLAKMVELQSRQADRLPLGAVYHGDALWFSVDGEAKLIHSTCESVVECPPPLWVNFMLMGVASGTRF